MSTAAFERAFYAADPAYDGRFVGAVRTTGIYCRPSCRARKPLPVNVTYLPDAAAARAAGYRPCLRCHPDDARPVTLREIDTPIGPMTLGATDDALVCTELVWRSYRTQEGELGLSLPPSPTLDVPVRAQPMASR